MIPEKEEDYSLGAYLIAFPLVIIVGFCDKVLDGIALSVGFWIAYTYLFNGVI